MLLSLWFLVVLTASAVVAAGCFVALGVVRRHWRRLAGRPRGLLATQVAAAVLTLALSLVAVLDGVNRHFSYLPTFAAVMGRYSPDLARNALSAARASEPPAPGERPPANGVVEKVAVAGAVSGIGARDTYVYLPPAYFDGSQPNRRFPVLYMLHGSPGVSSDWLRAGYLDRTMDGLLAHHAIDPFIVVMPDVNGGYGRDVECQDIPGGPQAQTYLVRDVVAFVDARYRTVADPSARAIGGLSTGGYCGLNLMLRHQDVFSAAVSHSGYGRPDQNRYTGDLFGGNADLRRQNTPDDYVATLVPSRPLGAYLDAGSADGESRADSSRLFDALRARGIAATLNIVQGESHDFVAFRRNLRLSLPWVSQWFAGQRVTSGRATVAGPDASDLPPPAPNEVAPATPASRCPALSASSGRTASRHTRPPRIVVHRQGGCR